MAVQALYEASINSKELEVPLDELLSHIIEHANFKNKITNSKLVLTKEIYSGVFSNLTPSTLPQTLTCTCFVCLQVKSSVFHYN